MAKSPIGMQIMLCGKWRVVRIAVECQIHVYVQRFVDSA